MYKFRISIAIFFIFNLSACEHPEITRLNHSDDYVSSAVTNSNRPAVDIKRDIIRSPDKVLQFFNIQTGDHVLELLAAGGYYTELLSRVVGSSGKVYMQNNQRFYDFQTDKAVIERLSNNRLPNVIRLDTELTNLQLSENSLDKLLMILVLHDFYWMENNVNLVIEQALKTLKPGGILGIIDHTAPAGSGILHASNMNGTHRIDKYFVIKTMLENGFILDDESNVLNQENDDRTKAFFSSELKGKPTDRFMLRFKKPVFN